MNTEESRAKLWKQADGQAIYRSADRIESHDGPLLKKRNGQIIRGIGDAVNEQNEPLIEDDDLENLLKE